MFSFDKVKVRSRSAFDLLTPRSGAHHSELPSPIQTLRDNLCAYLSIFRNCGVLRFPRTICHTVQYTTIRHSTTQLNTTQYITMHYAICFFGNSSQPGEKTVLKIERCAQRLTQGYMGDGGSCPRCDSKTLPRGILSKKSYVASSSCY